MDEHDAKFKEAVKDFGQKCLFAGVEAATTMKDTRTLAAHNAAMGAEIYRLYLQARLMEPDFGLKPDVD